MEAIIAAVLSIPLLYAYNSFKASKLRKVRIADEYKRYPSRY